MRFIDFCRSSDDVARGLEPGDRIGAASRLLARCTTDDELAMVSGWLDRGMDWPSPRRPALGSAVERRVYAALSGEPIDDRESLDHEIFEACRRMAGGTLAALRLLLQARETDTPESHTWRDRSLADMMELTRALAAARSSSERDAVLLDAWASMSATEIYWLHRLLSRSARARPLAATELEQALAVFAGAPLDQVRFAVMLSGDVGEVAVRARAGGLGEVRLRPMLPLRLMRAERAHAPLSATFLDPEIAVDDLIIEPLLPCLRVQAHRWSDGAGVALFGPDGVDLAPRLPEIGPTLYALPHGTVIDGGLIAVAEDGTLARPEAFAWLLRRGSMAPSDDRVPPLLVAFDAVVADGEPLLEETQRQRREHLESVCGAVGIPVVRAFRGRDPEQALSVSHRFVRAGAAGVVLKRQNSLYAFGRRDPAWRKVSAERHTAQAVIRYASFDVAGDHPRVVELTLGLWRTGPDGPRLVNICRVPPPRDAEELTARLLAARVQRFGPTWELRPEVVCSVRYESVKSNARTAAGCLLADAAIIDVLAPGVTLDSVGTVEAVQAAHRASSAAVLKDLLA